jgi:hypothetical protein
MNLEVQYDSRVEYGLRPPMAMTITLPVVLDGHRGSYICLYLTVSGFIDTRKQPSVADLQRMAKTIADRINNADEQPKLHTHPFGGAPATKVCITAYGRYFMCEACAEATKQSGFVSTITPVLPSKDGIPRCQCEHQSHFAGGDEGEQHENR